MTRIVTSETLAQAGAGSARPAYFAEIRWPTFSSRMCTYGTVTWDGSEWHGAGLEFGDFDESGAPSRMAIVDPDYTFRTLVLTEGLRDREILLWFGYIDALEAEDPLQVFKGVADGVRISRGRIDAQLGRNGSAWDHTPRERIAPAFGINFTAPPGTKVVWHGGTLVLNPRR